FNYSSARVLNSLDSFSKRFQNCIIFVDEAEKMIGRHSMDEDSNFDGYLNEIFDGVSGVTNAIVVIAVNNLARFGAGFSDRFVSLKFELPNLTERREFLVMKLNKLQNHAEVLVNFDEAARETEGMSFRDLEKICNNVFYMVLNQQQTITNHTFSDAARNFKTIYGVASIYG
ncbi:ATP-binding protein, partial [Candidatus Woesearchaeota archaeon]|nr:ATP-binding protein [Candidatus Woesearchaeota archaeon]